MKHIFDVEIAQRYGVNAAVLLENIGYWIRRNEANGTNFHDGTFWTFNSRRAYKVLFPYMSERQIETAFKKLIDDGILITGNYNAIAYDRTLWYALTQKGKSILHFDGMDSDVMSNGNEQNESPIPDITPDVNAAINQDVNVRPRLKPTRHKCGMYSNVLLSNEDIEKLKEEFPNDWRTRIDRLSEYIESTGKKYKNHLATIRAWARKENETAARANGTGDAYEDEMRRRWGAAADLI